MIVDESYGRRVVRLRKARKWTQKQLADESGVPLRTLQNIEADKSQKPHKGTILALNSALGIEGNAEETRAAWPRDIQTYLDIIGAFLDKMPEHRREAAMRDIATRIVSGD